MRQVTLPQARKSHTGRHWQSDVFWTCAPICISKETDGAVGRIAWPPLAALQQQLSVAYHEMLCVNSHQSSYLTQLADKMARSQGATSLHFTCGKSRLRW
ncbi:hypothetical protein Vafri_3214 [Volvox africanus]|uniref:Uncharacterized protein n=1 Tax=Volvox africanus TaxID=51714 RepID=A0A8J4ARB1_9CHLO|nr:hypothetical protein Vafri_3214 [Volvox africanus]